MTRRRDGKETPAPKHPVPELVSAYQRARTLVFVTAGLLFLWYWGIRFDGSLPFLGVQIDDVEALPYILLVVLVFALYRVLSEWFQSHPERRRLMVSRIDFLVTLAVGLLTILTVSRSPLPLTVYFPPLRFALPSVTLVVLGIGVGATLSQTLYFLQFRRSKEHAARLGLPRRPVAARATFRMAASTLCAVGLVLCLAPGFASPLSSSWPWLLVVPIVPFLVSSVLGVISPWRSQHASKLWPVFDMHDTHYQLGGWDVAVGAKDSPLYKAAERGNLEETVRLIETGADPNEQNMHGWTALLISVANQHAQCASHLLSRGADPNLGNFLGRTPIMFASRYGLSELVKELIAVGADVNLNKSPDPSALGVAAQFGHLDVVKMLLEAGAEVNYRDVNGKTAIQLAQEGRHGDVATLLRTRSRDGTHPASSTPVDGVME